MGQNMCCLPCRSYNTRVVPLRVLPDTKYSNSSLLARNTIFHRPMQIELKSRSSLENLSTEILNRSSVATTSLGSVQTLVSSKSEVSAGAELVTRGSQGHSPSDKRHPGLLTHGPDEGLVNPSRLSTLYEAPQGCNSPVPQRVRGSRSRSQKPLHTKLFTPRAPTPRPDMATIIVVRPSVKQFRASTTKNPGNDPERVCTHGIPLAGVNGDPCALCERPGSRGGQVIADMEALHWDTSKKQRARRLGKKNRGTDCGNAPRKFAERLQNDSF